MADFANIVKSRKRNRLLPLFGLAILLAVCVTFFLGFSSLLEQQIQAEHAEKLKLINQKTFVKLQARIAETHNKLQFLYLTPPISGLSRSILNSGIDPLDNTSTQQWKKRLQTIFQAFIQSNPEIRQIRYIGKAQNGKELVRVERHEARITVTPEGLLQEKGDTDYFQSIALLSPNEDYISDINLNREYGVIDNPMWPTFRLGKAVLDEQHQFFGILIINIDASPLIASLEQEFAQSEFELYVIDSQGYFVASPHTSLNFGLDLQRSEANWSFLTENAPYPIYDKLREIEFDGQVNVMLGSKVVLSSHEKRALYLITALPKSILINAWNKQRFYLVLLMVVIMLLIVAVVYGYQRYVNKLLTLYDDQSRYEAIVAGSSDAIVGIDSAGNILEWNESASYLFALNKNEAKKHKITDVINISDENVEKINHALAKVIQNNLPLTMEIETNKTADTPTKILSLNLSPVIPKNSAMPPSVSALIRDITELKNHQQQIISLNASLEKQVQVRTKELEHATEQAMSANQTKSAFVANISHEIRTPLNGIGGMLELLARDKLSTKQQSYLTMAKNSVATLTILINDLLDLTKIESGKLDINSTPFNLVETLSQVIETMSFKAAEKGLVLLFDCADIQHENVISDGYRIKQILINLLGNAIKFTESGRIWVSVSTQTVQADDEIFINIAVKDTGMGISAEQQAKLFTPFTQANNSIARDFGGTGLGLSISKQLSHLLGGEISVQSEVNQGSVFTFSIKAKKDNLGDYKTVAPILKGKRCVVLLSDTEESTVLVKQLDVWQANTQELRCIDELYQLSKEKNVATMPDLLVIDSKALDHKFETWHRTHSVNKKCKLLLVINATNKNINMPENDNCIYLTRPILPLSFLRAFQVLRHPDIKYSNNLAHTGEQKTASAEIKKHTVIIVDDNEINRYVAQGLLEHQAINFFTATNGDELIQVLKDMPSTVPIHLILMDCQMPIMDGYEATRTIRKGTAGEHLKDVPIIAMTAGAMAGDKDACLQAGMNDFISKPLEAETYEKLVMKWLTKL